MSLIEPRTLKGFRDYLPEAMMPREALIATAAALAVAIPATFGYNIFASRLNRYDSRLENFSTAVIALLVREGRI